MTKLKKTLSFETTFDTYVVDEILGEGGAGRVYGGAGANGGQVALKILAEDKATKDKRRRFKNEIGFLTQNKHSNIVTVLDHGIAQGQEISGPFYVMPRYHGNLRDLMRAGIAPNRVVSFFSQILNGVEAAHLKGVIHRDLKPENILYDRPQDVLAIADFGIARFTEDIVATAVETGPAQRLANFQYAAPEQRVPGNRADSTADIYALGLMLNEMFTGVVPHGVGYRSIGEISKEHGYLDDIVARMLRQSSNERPSSIADIKTLMQQYEAEAVTLQRLSEINGTVIKSDEIDNPLAQAPPKLIGFDWNHGQLTLILDRAITEDWIQALYRMRTYGSVMGKDPQRFIFRGNRAYIDAQEHQIQPIIDNFKNWLPVATATLKDMLEEAARNQERQRKDTLRREKEAEEQRLRVLRSVRI